MPPPTPPPAGPRREAAPRRETTARSPWACDTPEGRATDGLAGAPQLFGTLLQQARSQGQGGGRQPSDRGRPASGAPRRGAGDRQAQAQAAQAMLMDRCAACPGDGSFVLLLPGGTSLGVSHTEQHGALHLLLSTDDTVLGDLLRRDGRGLATRLTQQAGRPVAVRVA